MDIRVDNNTNRAKALYLSEGIKRLKLAAGLTLIEIMISIASLLVAIVGASAFRYYAALDARKADVYMTAARVGHLFCESWRGVKGSDDYDPTVYSSSEMVVSTTEGLDAPEEFTLLGSYRVVANSATYYMTLSWKDVNGGLRALNVVVGWAQQGQREADIDDINKLFQLTTYIIK